MKYCNHVKYIPSTGLNKALKQTIFTFMFVFNLINKCNVPIIKEHTNYLS